MTIGHEFYHYLFYRPSVSFSGFILEGEAIANGEYVHQMFALGMEQSPANAQDGFRTLFAKIMDASEEGTSDQDLAKFRRIADERMANAAYTAVQCDSLQEVYKANVSSGKPIDLVGLLSLSPEDFQRAKNVDLAYGQAWAVFHVEMIQKKEWGNVLQRAAKKLTAHDLISLNPTEICSPRSVVRRLLGSKARQIVMWDANEKFSLK